MHNDNYRNDDDGDEHDQDEDEEVRNEHWVGKATQQANSGIRTSTQLFRDMKAIRSLPPKELAWQNPCKCWHRQS